VQFRFRQRAAARHVAPALRGFARRADPTKSSLVASPCRTMEP
jgi:hypothetical protein